MKNEPLVETDLLSVFSVKKREALMKQLEQFLIDQDTLQPICIVSSGGTAVDLELNAVRHLENFSTGLRGAISVEEFVQRGYAVIHLWRTGSSSPYARFLNQDLLGLKQADYSMDGEALNKLFALEDEEDDDLVQTVLDQEFAMAKELEKDRESTNKQDMAVRLRGKIGRSAKLKELLEARREALNRRKLLTIPFRTVEQYLASLQIIAKSVADFNSFAMFYLAAAVSDFYVPKEDRSEHKIQSTQSGCLELHLKPVPKTMGKIRSEWAPQAFVVSFKLETDDSILRQKAERAVERYGCHMVIGNLLHSRHQKVSILSPVSFQDYFPCKVEEWPLAHIEKQTDDSNALESSIVDFVVQGHLEYISHTFGSDTSSMRLTQRRIAAKKMLIKRERYWGEAKRIGVELLGAFLAITLSYAINTALQQRLRAR